MTRQSEVISPRSKNILIWGSKFICSAGLIYWVISDVPGEQIIQSFTDLHSGYLFLAFVSLALGHSLTIFRWAVLIESFQAHAPRIGLLQSTWVAALFNNLLPSSIGGDALRGYKSWQLTKSKTQALSIILFDRALGMITMLLFAAMALCFVPQFLVAGISSVNLHWMVFIAALLPMLFLLLPRIAFDQKLRELARKDDQSVLRQRLLIFYNTIRSFSGKPGVVLQACTWSLFLQFIIFLHFYWLAQAFALPISMLDIMVMIPLSSVAMALPITINAIGVREYFYILFLTLHGVSEADGLAFAWVSFAFILSHGVIGGVILLFSKGGFAASSRSIRGYQEAE